MKLVIKIIITCVLLLFMSVIINGSGKPRIFHAAGLFQGQMYTNFKEALDNIHHKGANYIETDLKLTSDKKYVMVHDWHRFAKYCKTDYKIPTYEEFLDLRKNSDFTIMTLDEYAQWLRNHDDVIWITDIKDDNVKGLKQIARLYPDLMPRIIPQVYHPDEYNVAKDLGYEKIILTLYRYRTGFKILIEDFLRLKIRPWAVTMPEVDAKRGLGLVLGLVGIESYVHTINDRKKEIFYRLMGLDGVYSDIFWGDYI